MSLSTSYSPPPSPTRRPYHGSCHCGRIRYVVFVTLPPAALGADPQHPPSVRFYKCNCSTCQKMGIFHLQVPDAPRDFYLLAPLDVARLSDYLYADKMIHWYFCPACGVRCFAFTGQSEVVDVDLEAALGRESEGRMTAVWRCKAEGWVLRKNSYLSVNAHTIEPGQGLDLRELIDKKWVSYLDRKDNREEDRYDYPHQGGTW